jgi:transcriptional regulator with XRE-family HTH domain
MKNSTLAERIKEKRLELELTQEALAIKAQIPYATLSKIESGKVTNPTVTTLKKIADALELSIDYLLS